MELAQALLLLWRKKIWVALGLVVALGAGVASVELLKTEVYAVAETQMMVDSPRSPLGNAGASLDPFTARASVFADLMTSPPALLAIGQASGIPATQIDATGPASSGLTPAASTPSTPAPAVPSGAGSKFKLFLDQNPTLPTVDIHAEAPTTRQANALANGAVTGFGNYLHTLQSQTSISTNQRVEIRQLGNAVGGLVDPGANKKVAGVIVVVVLLIWCAMILLIDRLRGAWPASTRTSAAAAAGPILDEDDLSSSPTRNGSSEPRPEVRIESERKNGRRTRKINRRRTADGDAAQADPASKDGRQAPKDGRQAPKVNHLRRSDRDAAQVDPESNDGRRAPKVNHLRRSDRDAALAEFSDRKAALVKSPPPDEG
jgi:hypothetical protein